MQGRWAGPLEAGEVLEQQVERAWYLMSIAWMNVEIHACPFLSCAISSRINL